MVVDPSLFGSDATDCRRLFNAGDIRLRQGEVSRAEAQVDFGDDSGPWPDDGECDDHRFEGDAMGANDDPLLFRRDATDCRRLFDAGLIHIKTQGSQPEEAPDIEFGDDSGLWPGDGECDDHRFEGDGMGVLYDPGHFRRDATDCRRLFDTGRIRLRQSGDQKGVDFGDDAGQFANDGECDDGRFVGDGMGIDDDFSLFKHDASDCRRLFEAGAIRLRRD